MLTEVSGAQCLPERRASGRRQPVTDAAPGAGPDLSRGPAGQPPGSHKCHRVGAVLTRQSSTSSCRRSPSPELSLLRGVRSAAPRRSCFPPSWCCPLSCPCCRGPSPPGWLTLLAVAAGLSDSAFHPLHWLLREVSQVPPATLAGLVPSSPAPTSRHVPSVP